MGGFNLVTQGAASALDPKKAEAAQIKQFQTMIRNENQKWTKAKLKLMKYEEPNFCNEYLGVKGPLKALSGSTISVSDFRKPLMVKHHNPIVSKINTTNLLSKNRHFGFDPVDLVSGSYIYNRVDFRFPSNAPIEWAWNWNSMNQYSGSLGNKISFCFDTHIIYSEREKLFYYCDMEGRKVIFPYIANWNVNTF